MYQVAEFGSPGLDVKCGFGSVNRLSSEKILHRSKILPSRGWANMVVISTVLTSSLSPGGLQLSSKRIIIPQEKVNSFNLTMDSATSCKVQNRCRSETAGETL